jgi:hypothetical protein
VSVEFGAEFGVQTDFFMVSPWTGAETGRQNSTSPLVANSAPVSIPTSANPNSDEVFAGPDGAIYVLWDAGGPNFSSSQDSGATFFKNPTAIGIAISGGPASLVADACGNVTVVGESGTIDTFYQRSADGGNTFASPVDILDTHFNYDQQLAIDKAGNVNFTWAIDGPQFIEYVRLPTACSIH